MTLYLNGSIRYDTPDIARLRAAGYTAVDMHLHTCYSDGCPRIPDLLSYASKRGIGVAITDHNEISGALQAVSLSREELIIPGIELETREGPHLLIYFYTAGDLQDFFQDLNRERSRNTPELLENLPVSECLILAEPYDCLRIAAHPFGYFGINRGVLKCMEKNMLPGVLSHLDGIEVICGGMTRNLNQKAIRYAEENPLPFTGGSDAHILSEVGSVVTGALAGSGEEFLTAIKKRKNVVHGKPGSYYRKVATAGVIAWSFVPYTAALVRCRYRMQAKRAAGFFSPRSIPLSRVHPPACKKEEDSEKRGEDP